MEIKQIHYADGWLFALTDTGIYRRFMQASFMEWEKVEDIVDKPKEEPKLHGSGTKDTTLR